MMCMYGMMHIWDFGDVFMYVDLVGFVWMFLFFYFLFLIQMARFSRFRFPLLFWFAFDCLFCMHIYVV